jgi:uncharacterized repeat protein (TIGR03803 family)
MNSKQPIVSPLCLLLVLGVISWARIGHTQTLPPFTTLYSFTGVLDGDTPLAGLVQADDGNFYGTTTQDGGYGYGTVFQITPTGNLTTLHAFTGGMDGRSPQGSLIQGTDGALYGTAYTGGAIGSGTVFKITTTGTFTTLYSFSYTDGANPTSALVQASDGNLYGTTYSGGANGSGTVFQITSTGTFTTLYSFSSESSKGTNSDGANPFAPLVQAADGNLYGTTNRGGIYGNGTIFQITRSGVLATLYSFSGGIDGAWPQAGLIQASNGNLYGTTYSGGANQDGTIYQVTTGGKFTTLYSFSKALENANADGAQPAAALVQGMDGNLYGTTVNGGISGTGTIFRVTPSGTFTVLHTFAPTTRAGTSLDGAHPYASLVQGNDGAFYATTSYAGYYGYGTIFRLGPVLTLVSLTPASVQANTAFTLTLNGFGFVKGATVVSSEAPTKPLKTTFVGSNQLTATVPLSANVPLSAYPGNTVITVVNPDGTKSSANLTITVPTPILTSLSPKSLPAQSPQSKLTLIGNAFAPGAVVNWNGNPLATTYVSPTKLTALIPASDLSAPGTASVSVTNPQGGGTSQALTFTVTAVPHLALSVGTLTRSAGVITIPVILGNTGTADADTVQITSSVLNVTATSTALPVALGTVTAGGSANTTLTYPGSAGTKGANVTLTVSGTYIAAGSTTTSTFKLSVGVTLP